VGWIAGVVWLIAVSRGATFIYPYAHRLGLRESLPLNFWMMFFALDFLVLVVHELGHALATWAVGYRLKVICAGPVIVHRDTRGRRIALDWRRVLSGGGFVGAIPSSSKDLRANAMLIVFAGPFLTLNCAAVLFLILINMPGTALAVWWEPVALGAVLFLASFLRNMTPVGTADGSRLLQLKLRNRAGEEFLNLFAASTGEERVEDDEERATQSRASVDLDDEVAARARVVAQIKAGGGHDRLELAVAYQNLGIAQFHAFDPEEAEASLQAALKMVRQCRDVHPALEGNIWSVLCHIHRERHQAGAVESAYGRALEAFKRAERKGGVDPVQKRLVLASLHLHAGHPELALGEIEAGLAALPAGPQQAMNRAMLLRLQAECDLCTGSLERGIAAAREAATLLHSPDLRESEGRRAAAQLVALGGSLWKGGQGAEGVLIMAEGVEWLEQHGGSRLAALWRLGLAGKLREAGRLGEAESALPAEADLPANQRGALCAVRGRIRLAQYRFEEAVADFEQAVQLGSEVVRPNAVPIAIDKSGLAEALYGCGRMADAERQATEALEILLPFGHPHASEALITLALIGWQRGEPGADVQFEQAVRCIVDAPLLEPALKARGLQGEGERLRFYGRVNEVARAGAEASSVYFPQTKLAASSVLPLPV
jgi:tetratricopeptide (TPR) repeat protein